MLGEQALSGPVYCGIIQNNFHGRNCNCAHQTSKCRCSFTSRPISMTLFMNFLAQRIKVIRMVIVTLIVIAKLL
jgi:hypothetical protein